MCLRIAREEKYENKKDLSIFSLKIKLFDKNLLRIALHMRLQMFEKIKIANKTNKQKIKQSTSKNYCDIEFQKLAFSLWNRSFELNKPDLTKYFKIAIDKYKINEMNYDANIQTLLNNWNYFTQTPGIEYVSKKLATMNLLDEPAIIAIYKRLSLDKTEYDKNMQNSKFIIGYQSPKLESCKPISNSAQRHNTPENEDDVKTFLQNYKVNFITAPITDTQIPYNMYNNVAVLYIPILLSGCWVRSLHN